MAVYNISTQIPEQLLVGDSIYSSESGAYGLKLLPGRYRLECWGARGGYHTTPVSNNGGYAAGTLDLKTNKRVIIKVGGNGGSVSGLSSGYSRYANGGYNGGGSGYINSSASGRSAAGGGGATDIRIGQDSLYARVIVAGGGGGQGAATAPNACVGAGGGAYGLSGYGGLTNGAFNNRDGGGGTPTS